MSRNKDLQLIEDLKSLVKQKRSNEYYANKLGVSKDKIVQLKDTLKGVFSFEKEVKVDNNKGTFTSQIELDFEPKDETALAKLHKVNLSKYKISSYWSKLKSNGKFTSSIFCTIKKASDFSLEDFSKFLISYKPSPTNVTVFSKSASKKLVDVEISITDFHLDRKTLSGEDVTKRKEQFRNILDDLLLQATGAFNINKAVFVIGNDFFNSDNYQGSTTNLTPQENSISWNKAYEEGFDLLVESISKLNSFVNHLDIVLIQGNHDRTKSYYLAHALEVYFRNFKKITFLRENSTTKFIQLGKTFIGYHHGNTKIDDLPLLFATNQDSSKAFGYSDYREIHTGDKHYYMVKEIKGVRIIQIPSMADPDNWSNDNSYKNNIRAGLLMCYSPETGKCGEFESRINL